MGGGSWIWPDVDDVDSAKDAATKAAYFAWAVAVLSVIMLALLASSGLTMRPEGLAIAGIIILLYVIVGWQLRLLSRGWAVAGLILYLADSALAFTIGGPSLALAIRAVFLIGFINGVRGTFAYHRLSQQPIAPSNPLHM